MDDSALIMNALFARHCSMMGGFNASVFRIYVIRGRFGSRFAIYKTSMPSRSRRYHQWS